MTHTQTKPSGSVESEKLDAFCHWLPTDYVERATKRTSKASLMLERARRLAVITDLDARFAMMDAFPGYRQVLSLVSPAIEALAGPDDAPALARQANDALARLVSDHPDRFPGFVASLPMGQPEAAADEARRAVRDLGACGVQIFTHVNGHPLDRPETLDLFGLFTDLNAPVWLHPVRGPQPGEYPVESISRYETWWSLGWLYETSVAMLRLAFAGVFDRWPDLNVITHHAGAFIPTAEGRLDAGLEDFGSRTPPDQSALVETPLKEPVTRALQRFYADTASFGSPIAVEGARRFFGNDRILFATDMPFGPEQGRRLIRETIDVVESLWTSEDDRRRIFSANLRNLAPGLKP